MKVRTDSQKLVEEFAQIVRNQITGGYEAGKRGITLIPPKLEGIVDSLNVLIMRVERAKEGK